MSKTIIKKGIALSAALIIIGCNLIMVVEAATTPSTIEITGLETQRQELKSLPLEVNLMLPSTESDENFMYVKENPTSQQAFCLNIADTIKEEAVENKDRLERKAQQEKVFLRNYIVAYADQFVGNPYVWGGNSLTDGCDCSHFVWLVLRDTIGYPDGYTTSKGWPYRGVKVNSLAEAQAGDIICYSGHVAIYDGNGGIVEALNRKVGIVHHRKADSTTILAIRRFI